MMNSLQKLLVLLMLVSLPSCGNFSLGDSKIEGIVLDDVTGKPVAGAIVTAQWHGDIHGIVQGSSLCYHVEAVQTDANGKFVIPTWQRSDLSPREKTVSEKKRSKLVIPVTQERIYRFLNETPRMKVISHFTTKPVGQTVKIYSDYKLDLKLTGDFNYRTN